jgi:chemotaxis protein methyltransferase CheR
VTAEARPAPGLEPIPPLEDLEFARFQSLIAEASGIALGEVKRALLAGRLGRRVRELGLPGFGAYYARVVKDHTGQELVRMLDLVATNETSFFREPAHFEFLASRVIPHWRAAAEAGERGRTVRVWSAACSTGQEPYSVGMVLLDQLPAAEGWRVEILGTDLSTRALRVAQGATWPLKQAAGIPPAYLQRFMQRGIGAREGQMRATPELRATVRLERLNLHQERWPSGGPFDLILCRNVLIYFSPEGARAVVRRLADRLVPGGYLFVGHAEAVHGAAATLRAVAPTMYRHVAP